MEPLIGAVNIHDALPIKYGADFPANMPSITVQDMLKTTVRQFPDRVSHRFSENGVIREVTWLKYYQDVIQFAKSCHHVSEDPLAGVAIQGSNSYYWLVAHIGAIFAKCLPIGVYPTNSSEDSRYVADLVKSHVIVVENISQLKKYFVEGKSLTSAKCYVVWQEMIEKMEEIDKPVYTWREFIELGEKESNETFEKWSQSGLRSDGVCVIIPTSGTTGKPKGVMLSHDNITYTAGIATRLFDLTAKDRILSYLPLSHIAGQMLDCYAPMAVGAAVTFAGPDALKGKLGDYLNEVRPTIFLGVPRVYEKIQERMVERGREASGTKRTLVKWAKRKALENAQRTEAGRSHPPLYGLAKKLVLEKIPPLLGLDECRITATGAAPIRQETIEFWKSLEFSLLNVYGMSESTGLLSCNLPGMNKFGTAGKALKGTEMILMPPDENGKREIAARGRHIFMGYINNPEATAKTFTAEGYLLTGDYGEIDEEGYLTVTGRKKELIKTSGGEYVAPIPIEDRFKEELPFLSNVMVVGEQRQFLSAVVTLKTVLDANDLPTEDLAPDVVAFFLSLGSEAKTVHEALNDKTISETIRLGMERVNAKAVSNAQQVRKFIILPEDFKLSDDTLTPTMKLKRPQVLNKYAELIDRMYAAE